MGGATAASAGAGTGPNWAGHPPASADILATLDPEFESHCALIVVDVQNDFADPGGSLFVTGGDRVAELVGTLIPRAAAQEALVVCTQDWHPEVTPHFRDQGGPWPRHCVQGSWGAELHPSLPQPAQVIRKGMGDQDGYSAFSALRLGSGRVEPTPLRELLTSRGITDVFLAGLALDVCVRATALDSVAAGFATHLLQELTAAVNLDPKDGERALAEMAERGVQLI